MPKAATYALIWSSEQHTYELCQQGESAPQPLCTDDEHGLKQLTSSSSFAFQGQHGRLTLRKEARQHGEGYWYAYRSQGRRTLKKYAGRTADLTIARLEEIAEILNADGSANGGRLQVSESAVPRIMPLVEKRNVFLPKPAPVFVAPSKQHAPLLAPKLSLPRLPASLIAHELLLTRFDAHLDGKLTSLSPPAGFGTT